MNTLPYIIIDARTFYLSTDKRGMTHALKNFADFCKLKEMKRITLKDGVTVYSKEAGMSVGTRTQISLYVKRCPFFSVYFEYFVLARLLIYYTECSLFFYLETL